MSILITFLLTGMMSLAKEAKVPQTKLATPERLEILKTVDDKYLAAESITMQVKKTSKSGVFDQVQESEGTLKLKKGKLRLDLETKEKEKSLVVADGKFLWMITPPPKEFKGAKEQVLKAALDTKQARSQGLLQVLTEGGVLKYFKSTAVLENGPIYTYFLEPLNKSLELHRVMLDVNTEDQTISQLKYWDSIDNETVYSFSKVKFNEKLKPELFSYKPPKNADIISP